MSKLPHDIARHIGLCLDPKTLIKFTSSSKHIQQAFESEVWWETAVKKHFNGALPKRSWKDSYLEIAKSEENYRKGKFEAFTIAAAHLEQHCFVQYAFSNINETLILSKNKAGGGSWGPPDEHVNDTIFDINTLSTGSITKLTDCSFSFTTLIDDQHFAAKVTVDSWNTKIVTGKMVKQGQSIKVEEIGHFLFSFYTQFIENDNLNWRHHIAVDSNMEKSVYDALKREIICELDESYKIEKICTPYILRMTDDESTISLYNYIDDKGIWKLPCRGRFNGISVEDDCVSFMEGNSRMAIVSLDGQRQRNVDVKVGNFYRIVVRYQKILVGSYEYLQIFDVKTGDSLITIGIRATNSMAVISPRHIVIQDNYRSILLLDFGKMEKSFTGLYYKEVGKKAVIVPEKFTNFNLATKATNMLLPTDVSFFRCCRADINKEERIFMLYKQSNNTIIGGSKLKTSLGIFIEKYAHFEYGNLSILMPSITGTMGYYEYSFRKGDMKDGIILVMQRWFENKKQWEYVDMEEKNIKEMYSKYGFKRKWF